MTSTWMPAGAGAVVLGADGIAGSEIVSGLSQMGAVVRSVDGGGDDEGPDDPAQLLQLATDPLHPLRIVVQLLDVRTPAEAVDAEEVWHRAIDAVPRRAACLVRAAVPHLRASGGGAIVLVHTTPPAGSAPGAAEHRAAHAALRQYVRIAAVELASEAITVNLVAPAGEPFPRPDDVAGTTLFYASSLARHATGTALTVRARAGDAAAVDCRERLRLAGKAFIVLGAGRGIGLAVATTLSEAGASVLTVDREREHAERAADLTDGMASVADVTVLADIQRCFAEATEHFGSVHGLIDVVGMARAAPLWLADDNHFRGDFDIVAGHVQNALRVGCPYFAERGGGSLVFVSSLAGSLAVRGHAVYGAAKAALNSLVASAADEWGGVGVRVNAVAPGVVRTGRLLAALSEQQWAALDGAIPAGAAAEPADIANAAFFLSTPLGAGINGQVLPVDGGVSIISKTSA